MGALALAAGAWGTTVSLPAAACATCGCSLTSDAATGLSAAAGWRVSLEYNYLDQDQLRTGTSAIAASRVAAINDAGGSQEVEHDTINRYTTLGIGYAPDADWAFRLLVPYIDRGHTTYGAAMNPLTPEQLSGATVTGIGDVKFMVNYQGLLPTHAFGLQAGIKLPTGRYGGPNAAGDGVVGRNPVAFSTGPNSQAASPGNLLDTSLDAGTGSTDLILGAYYFRPVSQDFDAFISAQFQAAVSHKLDQEGEDYRPGNQQNMSVGLRYEADPRFVPQVQINLTHKSSDQGALADTRDTAGTVAYVSPGFSWAAAAKLQVYGFVQVPLYSNLQGYQLFPRWTASAGVSYSF
ncbi:MAG: transporter [Burkholderiaceae bacterium]|nr:transporter [Burkholderiaceae bacterium]